MSSIRAAVHAQTFLAGHGFVTAAFKLPYTDTQGVHTVGSSRTHILWSLGHLAWSYDVATGLALGLQPEVPESYHTLFGFGCTPTTVASDYPSLEELERVTEAAAKRVAARIANLTDEELAAPLPAGHLLAPYFPSIDLLLSMGAFHTGYHVGQIGLLRTAQGLPGAMGG